MSVDGLEVLGTPVGSPLFVDNWLFSKSTEISDLIEHAESVLHSSCPLAFFSAST